jgi:hypothetical protein
MQFFMVYQYIHDLILEQGRYLCKEDYSFTGVEIFPRLQRYGCGPWRCAGSWLRSNYDIDVGADDDLEQTKAYFRRRFQRLNTSDKKQVYPHFTDATDSKQLAHVMTAVSDIVLNENLQMLLL